MKYNLIPNVEKVIAFYVGDYFANKYDNGGYNIYRIIDTGDTYCAIDEDGEVFAQEGSIDDLMYNFESKVVKVEPVQIAGDIMHFREVEK